MLRVGTLIAIGASVAFAAFVALGGVSKAQVLVPAGKSPGVVLQRAAAADPVCRATYISSWTENGQVRTSREAAECPAPAGSAVGDSCQCTRPLSSGATEVALGQVAERTRIVGVLRPRVADAARVAANPWWQGEWSCTIDGRPARMIWNNRQGQFSDNGSAFVPLTFSSHDARNSILRFFHSDGNQWQLQQTLDPRLADGYTTWNGRQYPLRCRRP
jgi:hypothetical protein